MEFFTKVIIQARTGSTRLPGKVLREFCGKPILWHVWNRICYSKKVDEKQFENVPYLADLINFIEDIPPLRERKEDLAVIVDKYLKKYTWKYQKKISKNMQNKKQ